MKTQMIYKGLVIERIELDSERPTIIFLHDSLGCIDLWRDFPQKLAEATSCNILVYDRLGYGKSDPMDTFIRPVNYLELEADILNDMLTELKIKNVILFGHSDGGSIALIYASKYPDRIRAVLCEAGHIFVEKVTLQGIQNAIVQYTTTNLAEKLAKYHGEKVEAIFKAWTLTWTREDFLSWNIEHLLSNIICPLLFIQGEDDEYGSLLQVERTIEQVSGKAEKLIIPSAGHTPHKESPDYTLTEATRFILNLNMDM